MKIRLKVRCPMCNLTHFTGDLEDPTKLEFDEPVDPDISTVLVTSGGRGRIQNHINPLADLRGDGSKAARIEREILGLMLTKAETLVSWLKMKTAEV